MTPYSFVGGYQGSVEVAASIFRMKSDAVKPTFLDNMFLRKERCITTGRHNPQDDNVETHCCENLKTYIPYHTQARLKRRRMKRMNSSLYIWPEYSFPSWESQVCGVTDERADSKKE
jgi:hypothetical protein